MHIEALTLDFTSVIHAKKAEVQDKRYEQAEQEAEYLETKTLTDTQIEMLLASNVPLIKLDNSKNHSKFYLFFYFMVEKEVFEWTINKQKKHFMVHQN